MWAIALIPLLFSACVLQAVPGRSPLPESTISRTASPGIPLALESATSAALDPNQGPPQAASPLPSVADPPTVPTQTAEAGDESQRPTSPAQPAAPAQASTIYYVQPGDTLKVVARRFNVFPAQIASPRSVQRTGLLDPGSELWLPIDMEEGGASSHLLPDSEIVYGPSSVDFDISHFLNQSLGYLSQHREYLRSTGWTSASDIITRVALENSINPRLLLAVLEYSCGCIMDQSSGRLEDGYVLGVEDYLRKGLYGQLWWAANKLSTGYYGWRDGSLLDIALPDGSIHRPAPDSNAGTVALQYYFAQLWSAHEESGQDAGFDTQAWAKVVDPGSGLSALHSEMFGDPWARDEQHGALLPAGLQQPEMILPFEPDYVWSYASGPHPAWQSEGALAALDFAPSTHAPGCIESNAWVVAVADGPVVRSAHGAVIQDLDHDGKQVIISDMHEETGWVVMYMHIASTDRAAVGTYLKKGDPLGHPSCEGGPATGTHVHIARKYNGEWIAADGPLPFVLSGWTAHAGEEPYKGTLTRGDITVTAHTSGNRKTQLSRPADDD